MVTMMATRITAHENGLVFGAIELQGWLVFQHEGPKPASSRLRQQLDHIGPEGEGLEVDEGNAQLPRQAVGQQLLGNDAGFNQQAPHLFTGGALQVQGLLQLLLRDQLLLNQHIAQTQFLRAARGGTGTVRRTGRCRCHVHALFLLRFAKIIARGPFRLCCWPLPARALRRMAHSRG